MKRFVLFTVLLAWSLVSRVNAQAPRAPVPATGKAAAPVDLTGYWVSVVTEDWRWRMVTPLKGDAASIPINAAARQVVDAWDPAKDEAAGLQCKSYGAPAVMRIPGRLHITWQDDNTLKIETDAGTQTRLFHFGGPAPEHPPASWQGYSAARWIPQEAPGGGLGVRRAANPPRSLEVMTTQLRSGYLRKNGVPYSEKVTLTEYYDGFTEPEGKEWFTVTTIVTDPTYLGSPFVTTTDFKKQPDASGWNPKPCLAR
jgi:hypothetical protein